MYKSASTLRLCLFHCLSFSVLPHGFERRRTCSYCYISAPFFIFFLTQVFTPFHICASLYFSPSPSSFHFFFIAIFLYSHLYAHLFYRPQLYSSALHRTRLSPCLFQFSLVSIFAQRQASYNSYTSLLPHSSCDHAYYVHFGTVSS